MKKHNKPYFQEFVIHMTDVITTSSGALLDDIVQSVPASNSRTQAYNFTKLFGE